MNAGPNALAQFLQILKRCSTQNLIMRLLSCIFLMAALSSFAFAGEPQTPKPLPEDSVKLVAARHAILEIWKSAQVYYQDRGDWPGSISQLFDLKYVVLDSGVNADWNFTGNPPVSISAQQKYLAKNARKDGFGAFHRLTYDIETGYWSGSGVPNFGRDTLTVEQQAMLTPEVQSCMSALVSAGLAYYNDRGEGSSVVELDKNHYLIVPTSVKINWNLCMYGAPLDSVVAISTEWMPDGPGRRLVYYPAERMFQGYGVVDPHYNSNLTPYLEYVNPKH